MLIFTADAKTAQEELFFSTVSTMNLLYVKITTRRLLLKPISLDYQEILFFEFTE